MSAAALNRWGRRLDGRRAFVTGGGSGIGRATVIRLAEEGARVVASGRSPDRLRDLDDEARDRGLGDLVSTRALDVRVESDVVTAVREAAADIGGLDILVNSAGIMRGSHTESIPTADWDDILRTNLTGTFLVTRAALPLLVEAGRSAIINVGSTSASCAQPYLAAYAASKAGVQAFTRAIAMEYSRKGVRAVCVSPGSVETELSLNPGIPEDVDIELFLRRQPYLVDGFADVSVVSGVIAMLASDDGAFITGEEIRIDGGTHM